MSIASLSTEGIISTSLHALKCSHRDFAEICMCLNVPVSHSLISLCVATLRIYSKRTAIARYQCRSQRRRTRHISFNGSGSLCTRLFPVKRVPGARFRHGASHAFIPSKSAKVGQPRQAIMQTNGLSY
jgi:hypothetical protein